MEAADEGGLERVGVGREVGPLSDAEVLERAAGLVKFDLGSQMVTEMTGLAGVMAREYLLAAGESEAVAQAVFEAELPRHAGDRLPESLPGALLALADRLDALTGLAVTVGLPTGSSDPFALRRAALGVIAIHRNTPALLNLSLARALAVAGAQQPVEVGGGARYDIWDFIVRRFEQHLLDEGHAIDRVRAVLVHADRPRHADVILNQLGELSKHDSFRRLAAALQRCRRIAPSAAQAENHRYTEPAEHRLHEIVARISAQQPADLAQLQAASGDLPQAVDDLFDAVLVMADDPDVRAARLALVASAASLGDSLLNWPELRLG